MPVLLVSNNQVVIFWYCRKQSPSCFFCRPSTSPTTVCFAVSEKYFGEWTDILDTTGHKVLDCGSICVSNSVKPPALVYCTAVMLTQHNTCTGCICCVQHNCFSSTEIHVLQILVSTSPLRFATVKFFLAHTIQSVHGFITIIPTTAKIHQHFNEPNHREG